MADKQSARRHFIGSSAAALTSLAIASPVAAQTAFARIVVAAVPAPDMGTILYARSQNAFAKAGITMELQSMSNGPGILAAAVGGSVQVGYANSYSLVQAYQRGIPLRLISPGGIYDASAPTNKKGLALVVAGNSTIKSAKDLVGKTVGGPTVSDIIGLSMFAWLTHEGVDPASVHFLASAPNLVVAALQAGRVEAIATFEPFLSAALAAGGRVIATPFDAIGNTFLTSAWFGVLPWLNDHQDIAHGFAAVMTTSATYANAHYSEMIPLISDFSKIQPDILAKMTQSRVPPSVAPSLIQPVIDAASRFHQIPTAFKAEEMIFA
jgi:NitT/TauT family transport system substrate-binding protein